MYEEIKRPDFVDTLASFSRTGLWMPMLWEMVSINRVRSSYSALEEILQPLGFQTGTFIIDFETLQELNPRHFITYLKHKNAFVLVDQLDVQIILHQDKPINKDEFLANWDGIVLILEGVPQIKYVPIDELSKTIAKKVAFKISSETHEFLLGSMTGKGFWNHSILAFEKYIPTELKHPKLTLNFHYHSEVRHHSISMEQAKIDLGIFSCYFNKTPQQNALGGAAWRQCSQLKLIAFDNSKSE